MNAIAEGKGVVRLASALMVAAFIVPQSLLLLSNIHAWGLIKHQADDTNTYYALCLVSAQVFVLAVNVLALAYLILRRQTQGSSLAVALPLPLIMLLLVVHVGLLVAILSMLNLIIPREIPAWMLNQDNHLYLNVALVMPAAFLCVYAIIKHLIEVYSRKHIFVVSFASVLGVPLTWYLVAVLLQPVSLGQVGVILSVITAALLVLIFIGGAVALLDTLLSKRLFADSAQRQSGFAFLVGLCAPIAGLLLNHEIPFPNDFQNMWVYVLTVINAFVLMLPVKRDRWGLFRLYLRGFCLPFVVYFFLVFLPFLPLSMFAIFVMGAGLLMLAPLALGIFQARITWLEFTFASLSNSSSKTHPNKALLNSNRTRAIGALVLGLLSLPCLFVVKANLDKHALHAVLDYFYASSKHQVTLSNKEIEQSSRVLINMRNLKQGGVQLPFIASTYNDIVYGGMVLGDAKINQLYYWLNDQPMPEMRTGPFLSRSARSRWAPRFVAPNPDVVIEGHQLSKTQPTESTLRLRLRNRSNDTHAIYKTRFQLPEGVFISGMRLKIEGKWVPAKIHDKKTALWVFKKITEVRRDPALLYYENSNVLNLQVYPFPAAGVREVELQFNYHPSAHALVSIDDVELELNQPISLPELVRTDGTVLINGVALDNYAFEREPFLHFILPSTQNQQWSTEDALSEIQSAARKLSIDTVKVSAANLTLDESSDLNSNELISAEDIDQLRRSIALHRLPARGGLWLDNVFTKLIKKHNSLNIAPTHKPIFVVLAGHNTTVPERLDIANWHTLLPDVADWVWFQHGVDNRITQLDSSPDKVVVLRQGEHNSVIAANNTLLLSAREGMPIRVYKPESEVFDALEVVTPETYSLSKWGRRAQLWLEWKQANRSKRELDKQRSDLLSAAAELTMVLPTTAAIVVENGAQWEMLKRKQKKSLDAHSAFDFEDQQNTPEPAEWLLIVALMLFLWIRKYRLDRVLLIRRSAT